MHALTCRATVMVALAASLALAAGCKKEQEYLALVSLKTATPVAGLSSAKITVGGTAKTFSLSELSSTPTVLGVYFPDDHGKQVQVSVGVQAGASCVGLAGSSAVTIGADNTGATEIELVPGNACSDPQPPSLRNCNEYDHVAAGTGCQTASGDSIFVRSVAFSPEGRHFATAANDGRVKLWIFDGRTLREDHVIPKPGVPHVAFSPDGKLLAVGSIVEPAEPVDLYEVGGSWNKRRSLTASTGYLPGLGFTPDSRHVVVLAWDGDVTSAVEAFPVDGGALTDAVELPFKPFWLAVGQTETDGAVPIAVASFDDRVALLSFDGRLLSTPTIFSITNNSAQTAWAIGFSPDGKFLAAGGDDNQFRFWNVPFQSATPVSDPFIVAESLTTLAFSPANDYVAVASGAGNAGTVTIWDRLTESLRGSYHPTFAPYGIAYAPSGTTIAGGEDGCGKVFVCAD